MEISKRSEISLAENKFKPLPKNTSGNLQFMQARFDKLSKILNSTLKCKIKASPDKVQIIQISPSIILDDNKYEVIQYLNKFNDLSPTLALYLSGLGFNTGYIIARSTSAKGIAYVSHSYLGKPRIYSGPIKWENQKIQYTGPRPFKYSLKLPHKSLAELVIVSFSNEETIGAQKLLKERSIEVVEIKIFKNLSDLLKSGKKINC